MTYLCTIKWENAFTLWVIRPVAILWSFRVLERTFECICICVFVFECIFAFGLASNAIGITWWVIFVFGVHVQCRGIPKEPWFTETDESMRMLRSYNWILFTIWSHYAYVNFKYDRVCLICSHSFRWSEIRIYFNKINIIPIRWIICCVFFVVVVVAYKVCEWIHISKFECVDCIHRLNTCHFFGEFWRVHWSSVDSSNIHKGKHTQAQLLYMLHAWDSIKSFWCFIFPSFVHIILDSRISSFSQTCLHCRKS